ncbi:GNAT family N-acetyltransferase [Oerskovia turbata]|uniref:GNAT family N-acetyltransferase n=1 Tax=Oerskovia turbata TaxID=1713 RepID=A0A4Q1KQU8_9CELL|nr:GNAT family N-acetyltransferase [Oerskovia turbata]RXR22343.1 GNAT family N-acetyltransferase [Oerskovia turbata]RXR32408.1 GNAT family N-acetyltransferase [Oerskovia turbata]TGJ95911.1 GNAT family N-acetyltransferase [Actinotalea fermentans ATCC 43279 = JCM 9966 = DSM 3133]
MTTVRDLHRSEHRPAAALLARAFATDPLFLDLFGDVPDEPDARRRALRFTSWVLGANRLLGGRRRAVLDSARIVGVAVVEPPQGATRRTVGAALAALRFAPVALALPTAATARLNRYGRETRALVPATPHHYLTMIGVDPAAQGAGLGRVLLDDVVELAERDPRSAGVGLDTENPDNLGFYARHGFAPCGELATAAFTAHVLFRPRGS